GFLQGRFELRNRPGARRVYPSRSRGLDRLGSGKSLGTVEAGVEREARKRASLEKGIVDAVDAGSLAEPGWRTPSRQARVRLRADRHVVGADLLEVVGRQRCVRVLAGAARPH